MLGASLAAVLLMAGAARWLGLGSDVRIESDDDARRLAAEAVPGFEATDVIVDRAGIAALLRDARGRQMLLRRHGVHFAGRLLDAHVHGRLDQRYLTIATAERSFGEVTLDLGDQAPVWAAGLRTLRRG